MHNGLNREEREAAISRFHPGGDPVPHPPPLTVESAKEELLALAVTQGLMRHGRITERMSHLALFIETSNA